MKTIVTDLSYAGAATKKSTICWKSAVAGLFIAFLTLSGLLALGMAFGGYGLDDGSTLENAGRFAGIWFLVSAVVALFVGAFFSSSVARRSHAHVGATQGLLVAGLFFAVMLYQTASAIGWIGRAAGATVAATATAAGAGAASAANSPMVNEIVEDAMGDANVPPEKAQAVVTGVASRLLNGRPDAARAYLSRQTGISEADANARIAALKTQIDQLAVQAREKTAAGLKTSGWALFLMLVLGASAAAVGGALASHLNAKNVHIAAEDERAFARMNPNPRPM